MHSAGSRKRKSDQITMDDEPYTVDMVSQKVPTKTGTPQAQEGPVKRQRVGITAAQKQALIENLQLEITERARKLRANYNIHAQTLRTRIEIRVNRLPLSLRKVTMGELLEKYSTEQPQRTDATTGSVKGPPVPSKDPPSSRPPVRAPIASRPVVKRTSHEISGGDKENEVETPQKKMRSNTITDISRQPTHVLSPTTSNSRIVPRTIATPGRSNIARPAVTPGRAAAATTMLNKMVERSVVRPTTAHGTAITTTLTTTRKPTALSSSTNGTSSTTSTTATNAAKNRKRGATISAAVNSHPPCSSQTTTISTTARPATRTARRASGTGETSSNNSEGNRKRPMTAPPGAQPKPPVASQAAAKRSTVVSGFGGFSKKSVSGGAGTGTVRRGTVGKAGAAAATAAALGAGGGTTGRVLRKRA
ncbi:hypothetical protein VTI74DRAFT_6322 [Chaetomium olivicolor]